MMNWKVVLALMVTFALMMSSSYTMLIPFLPLYMQNELKATSDEIAMWSGFMYFLFWILVSLWILNLYVFFAVMRVSWLEVAFFITPSITKYFCFSLRLILTVFATASAPAVPV